MSPGVVQVRADICRVCRTPCERQHDGEFHATACAACRVNRWGKWGDCRNQSAPSTKLRGLGDLVAVVAEPIARAIGLDKSKCGCAARREALNRAVPFGR